VQYDGLVHLLDPEQRRSDIDRDELARAAGWEVVVLTARDLRDPAAAVGQVAAAYSRSSARGGMARAGTGSRDP
jgi:very-short-patch-repair endonuclease